MCSEYYDLSFILVVSYLNRNERNHAMEQFLDTAQEKGFYKNFHFLSFCAFGPWELHSALKPYITQSTSMGLYQVLGPGDDTLRIKSPQVPGFEMSLV